MTKWHAQGQRLEVIFLTRLKLRTSCTHKQSKDLHFGTSPRIGAATACVCVCVCSLLSLSIHSSCVGSVTVVINAHVRSFREKGRPCQSYGSGHQTQTDEDKFTKSRCESCGHQTQTGDGDKFNTFTKFAEFWRHCGGRIEQFDHRSQSPGGPALDAEDLVRHLGPQAEVDR